MFKLYNIKNNQNGQSVIIAAFILFLLIGVGGMVVDASNFYVVNGEMRKAADAASLAGAGVMFVNDAAVTNTVNNIISDNHESDSSLDLKIKPGGENKVTVKLDKTVSTFFMKVFGVTSVPISVTSSAIAGPLGGASGVLPIGISDESVYEFGKDYQMNYTAGTGTQGNYGYLDFTSVYKSDGTTPVTDPNPDINSKGAPALNYFLLNGFGPEIDYGYVVYSQPGVIKNKVEAGITPHVGQTVIILLYDHNDVSDLAGQSSPVHITGFAFFTIKSIDTSNNLVTGTFVKKVTSGPIDSNAKDWGAYGIKLVE